MTICQGQNTTLTAPAGCTSYAWSTGPATQSITVNTAGNYSCTVVQPTGNLVVNGDFSAGNTGFTSQFTYNTNLVPEPTYFVDNNTVTHHTNFFATGNGNFLMANAGAADNNRIVWQQSVPVCPGTTYTFSFSGCDISGTAPPTVRWYVNGAPVSVNYVMPLGPGNWQTWSFNWTAPIGVFNAVWVLRVLNPVSGGSDLGIDDISLSGSVTMTDAIQVFVNPLPSYDLGPSITACSNNPPTLIATVAGATYHWQNNAVTPTLVATTTGTYSVDVTLNGCTVSDQVNVTINPQPVMNCGGPYPQQCLNSPPLALNGTPVGGTWSGGGVVGNTFDPALAGAGNHLLTYSFTDANGCSNSCTVNVNVATLPIVNCGSYPARCVNAPAFALGGFPAGGTWSGAGVVGNTFDPSVAGPGTHAVTYTITNAVGCSNSCTTNITVNDLPVLNCGSYGPVCEDGSTIALGGVPSGGTWNGPGVAANVFDPNLVLVGTYALTYAYTDANGCSNNCTTNITVNALPVLNCGSYGPLCVNAAAINLGGTPAGGTWSGPGVALNTFDPAAAGIGTHAVTYTYTDANGCTNTCSTNITVNALPVVNCGSYGPLCMNAMPINLGGTPVAGTWSGAGVNANTFDPSIAGAGVHTVTYSYTNSNGCTNICSTNITVNALPVLNCGSYGPLCVNAAAINLGGAPVGGTWSGAGVNANTFDPAIAGAGQHPVTYSFTDANGCGNTCTTNITVNALPVVNCGSYGPFCVNEAPINLGGSPIGGTWSGPGVNANVFDPSSAGTGTHAVTYTFTDANGCANSCSTNIIVDALPVLNCGSYGPLCVNATPIGLGGSPAGGTWSGPGVNANSFDPSFAGVGTHAITYTFTAANGCSNTCTTNIVVNGLPAVNCGNYGPLCLNAAAINLAGTPTGGTWSGPGTVANSFDPTVAGNGTHAVVYSFTDANSCANTCTTNITVNGLPVVDAGTYPAVCANASPVTLAGTPSGGSWTGAGVTGNAFDPSVPGAGNAQVTYTYADVNGCSASDNAQITVNSIPAVSLGNDTTVCPGAAVTFDATTPGASYLWQDNSIQPTLTTSVTGQVSVQVTVNGCSASDATVLSNFNLQTVNLGADITACAGDQVPLSISVAGASYTWNDGSHLDNLTATTTGWYWVDAALNGCSVRDSIHVTFNPLPSVNLGLDRMVCPGATALLNATTPNATYLWSNSAVTPTVNAGVGQWSVTVTVNGCSASDVVMVNNWTAPQPNLGNDTTLCPGATLLLNATTPFMTYQWQDGALSSTYLVQQAGQYSVTLTDTHGCTGTDAVQVSYATPNPVFIGNDTTICAGTVLTLDGTTPGATAYSWNNGYQVPTLPVQGSGLYWLDVLQGNCLVTDSIHVLVAQPPSVDLGSDTTLCPGATLLLDATTSANTYLWQDGSAAATYLVGAAGEYHVTVTDANHCAGRDTINVAFADPSAIELGPDATICSGTSITLDATLPGSTYLWNTSAQTPTIDVTDAGTYIVTVSQSGCAVVDSIHVFVLPTPPVALGNDTTLCDGATLTLDANYPGATYLWQDNSASPTFSVSDDGTYSVTVTLNGCSASDAINISYVGPLAIDLGPDTLLCPGTSLLLTAFLPGGTTVWSTNTVGAAISVSQPAIYWANVTVAGCSTSDSITVGQVPLDALDLGDDASVCDGNSIGFDITVPGASYLWDDNSTEPTRWVDQEGDYWARIMLGGCETSDTIHLAVIPVPQVWLGPDTGLCATATLPIDVSVPGGSYLWNDGYVQGARDVGAGDWSVQVTVDGCAASDAIHIDALPSPVVDLPTDTTLCDGSIWMIDVAQPNATYLWQDNSVQSGFLVDQPGSYSVSVHIGSCAASDAVNVSYFDASTVDLGPDTTLCPGTSLVLQLQLPGADLTWPDGSHGNNFTVSTAGAYTVTANANGCMADDAINVSYVPLVHPDLGEDRTLCFGDTLMLIVDPADAQVTWSTGSQDDSLQVTTSGHYEVTFALDGCIAQDAIYLEFLPVVDSIDLGPDATICLGRTLELDASTARASYVWNTGSQDPSITVQYPGTYVVRLSGPCIHATDTIVIAEGNCAPLVFVPNAFTPNGDGFNDVFAPTVSGTMITFTFNVFDRWGENIFTSTTPNDGWDGTYGGRDAQDGVYSWTLSYKAVSDEGVKQERLMGSVTLLR